MNVSDRTVSGEAAQPPSITSPITGRVDFGWISEAWRLFSAQGGVWISATLIFFAPPMLFVIAFYIYLFATMFPGGFPPHPPVPASAPSPSPFATNFFLVPGNSGKILTLEIAFGLVYMLWTAYMYGGLFRMAVRQVRGLPIEFRDLFRGGPLFGRMLGVLFLIGFGTYGLEALCLGPVGILTWQKASTAAIVIGGGLGLVLFFAFSIVLTGLLLPAFALLADGMTVIAALKRSVRGMKSVWPAAAGFILIIGLLVYASEIPCGLGLLATIPMVFLITALAYRDMLGMPDMAPPPAPYYPPPVPGVWPPPPSGTSLL